jgi:hypothetical protein
MASTHKSLRSGTANKRPTTSIADGQIALNTNTTSPGLFFKDSTGATIIKVGPVHVGTTAPNASPAAGGSAGNSVGEIWLDTSLTPVGVKIWNGSAFVNATPIGSTTVQGLLELATSAETQTGTDTDRAVTPAGLQSKVSDSTSTTSSTTIASSTAVKSAYDLANAALPKSGGTVTGNLEIGTTGSLSFEGATADAFETTIAVTDPTADRTITLPDTTGTVVTTGDTGTVTSAMIADGTIVNGDINASAAIAHTKLANITAGSVLMGDASNIPTATALSGDVTVSSSGVTAIGSGVIVNADVNASAAIAGTKISPDFGSQTIATTGIVSHALGTAGAPTVTFTGDTNTGIYSPGTDQVAISTNGTGRLFVDANGNVTVDSTTFYVDAVNNRVGIGTVTPSSNGVLDVTHTSGTGLCVTRGTKHIAFSGNYAGADDKTVVQSSSGMALAFHTNGDNERARITSDGKLGLGTSSPTNILHVTPANASGASATDGVRVSAGTSSVGINIGANSSATFGWIQSSNAGVSFAPTVINPQGGNVGIGASPSAKLHVNTGTNENLWVGSLGGSGAGVYLASVNDSGSANTPLQIGSASDIRLAINGTEAARVDSSRRLLVGTSSSVNNDSLFQVSSASGTTFATFSRTGTINNTEQAGIRVATPTREALLSIFKHSGITNPCAYLNLGAENGTANFLWADNSDILRISTNPANVGTTGGTVVGTQTSDERLKNIIGPVEYGLDTLKQIEPVRYSLKSEPETEKIGFIAQQVRPLIPESVFDTGEHIEGEPEDAPTKLVMEYVALVPVLINAIKELSAEVDALKAQLQAS